MEVAYRFVNIEADFAFGVFILEFCGEGEAVVVTDVDNFVKADYFEVVHCVRVEFDRGVGGCVDVGLGIGEKVVPFESTATKSLWAVPRLSSTKTTLP